MNDHSAWDAYAAAARRHEAAISALLDSDYTGIVRASVDGRGPGGPRSYRPAIDLLSLVPVSWLNENLDVVLRLALDGGDPWHVVRPLLDVVDSELLERGLRGLARDLTRAGQPDAGEFLTALRLFRDLDRRDLQADIIDLAGSYEDDETRSIADRLRL